MHIYIYIYKCMYVHIYIYIYRERERDRDRYRELAESIKAELNQNMPASAHLTVSNTQVFAANKQTTY